MAPVCCHGDRQKITNEALKSLYWRKKKRSKQHTANTNTYNYLHMCLYILFVVHTRSRTKHLSPLVYLHSVCCPIAIHDHERILFGMDLRMEVEIGIGSSDGDGSGDGSSDGGASGDGSCDSDGS